MAAAAIVISERYDLLYHLANNYSRCSADAGTPRRRNSQQWELLQAYLSNSPVSLALSPDAAPGGCQQGTQGLPSLIHAGVDISTTYSFSPEDWWRPLHPPTPGSFNVRSSGFTAWLTFRTKSELFPILLQQHQYASSFQSAIARSFFGTGFSTSPPSPPYFGDLLVLPRP